MQDGIEEPQLASKAAAKLFSAEVLAAVSRTVHTAVHGPFRCKEMIQGLP